MCKEKENKSKSEFQEALESFGIQPFELDRLSEAERRAFEEEAEARNRHYQEIFDAIGSDLPTIEPKQRTESDEVFKKYEASVNKFVESIEKELDSNKLDEEKLLGSLLATIVRRRLGDISVDGADIVRSRGDQCYLVESLTKSLIESMEDWVEDYIDYKFYPGEKDWYSVEQPL